MKFIVQSKQLYSVLQSAGRVINSKNTLPILDCFLLGLQGDVLRIAASDSEIRISTKIYVQNANGNSTVCLKAREILDALKELPDQQLTIEVDDNTKKVQINYHNGNYSFVGQSADEYPQPRHLDDKTKQSLKIEADTLEYVINGTLFAVGNDELRPVMSNIHFDITPENVTFVSSNGHKMVRVISKETKGESRSSFNLPTKAANLLKNLLSKQSNPVPVRFDLNNVVFDLTDMSITVRLTEGRYPNYNQVIPTNNQIKLTISRSVLLDIVKRVSVFSNKASNMIKLALSANKLNVSAQDIDFSTSAEENTEVDYGGEPFEIGFKATFLIETLSNMQSDEIELQFSEPNRAAVIVPTQNNAGYDYLGLIMPMCLND